MTDVNVAIVEGRVEGIENNNGRFFHRVTIPAPDEYSSPGSCMVEAASRLVEPGQTLKIKGRLTGWTRKFQKKDGSPGYEVNMRVLVS